jgi:hypothetical protein
VGQAHCLHQGRSRDYPQDFFGRWAKITLTEKVTSQLHFMVLCGLLDQLTPHRDYHIVDPWKLCPSVVSLAHRTGAVRGIGRVGYPRASPVSNSRKLCFR